MLAEKEVIMNNLHPISLFISLFIYKKINKKTGSHNPADNGLIP